MSRRKRREALPLINLTDTVLAYFAGFFDGEGCVVIAKATSKPRVYGKKVYLGGYVAYFVVATVTNTDVRIIHMLHEAFGGSIVRDIRNKVPKPTHRLCWRWQASGRAAIRFLETIRPFVRLKAEQVDLAIGFQRGKNWQRLTPEVLAERDFMKTRLAAMKHAS